MRLEHLALTDFRNYVELELEPQPGLNVFIGPNAQGKSNLLEAIAVLGVGKSFRGARDGEMIRAGAERAVVRGRSALARDAIEIACSIVKSERGVRKAFSRSGRTVPFGRFLGTLPVVTFVPSDLRLIDGPPSLRRAFLNTALAQRDAGYYRALSQYQAALRQKNAVLRGENADGELLAVYDRVLVENGARLTIARRSFVGELEGEAQRAHALWSGGERLALRYVPDVPTGAEGEETARTSLARRLRELAPIERLRRTSLAGPHRDDLEVRIDGRPLHAFGSQGQCRTAVLAVKVAEYTVMRNACGEAPLLLLDDVLSELDEHRAGAFLAGVGDYEQAYVTATHRPQALPEGSALFSIDAARVCRG